MTELSTRVKSIINNDIDVSYHKYVFAFLNDHLEGRTENYAVFVALMLKHLLKNTTWNDFNWELYTHLAHRQKVCNGQCGFNTITHFLVFLVRNNLYDKMDKDEVVKIIDILGTATRVASKNLNERCVPGVQPWNVIYYQAADKRLENKDRILFAKGLSKDVSQLVNDYYNLYNNTYNTRIKEYYDTEYFSEFFDSLENKFTLDTIEDFGDAVFEQQIHYFYNKGWSPQKKLGFVLKFHIYVQYRMGEKLAKQRYKIYDIDTLKYNVLMSKILEDGYKVVNYSVHDKPVFVPKMLIKQNNMDLSSTITKDYIMQIDCTGVKSKYLQELLFDFFWHDISKTLNHRREMLAFTKEFLTIIEEQFEGIYSADNFEIGINTIVFYKQKLINKKTTNSAMSKRFTAVKKFFNFLINSNVCTIDKIIFQMLTITNTEEAQAYKDAFTEAEINEIINAMKTEISLQKSPNRVKHYQLYLYAFTIFTISDIRISSIFALTTDCVKETLTRKGTKEYKVVVQSKTSGSTGEEYNITKYVKKIIDEILEYTSEIRDSAPKNLKSMLFINQNEYRGGISQLRVVSFTEYFNNILKKYSIRKLRLAAVRNYYMQNVSNYVFSNGFDKSLIEKLSNHTLQVHINHYDNVDIKAFCQNYYNVEIGNVYLRGSVDEQKEFPKEQTVANGCGHCSLKKCKLTGKLDCFMCQYFVTTLDCIPFYKLEIDKIDGLIQQQKIPHEQEFLISKKKILVAYLERLLEKEAAKNEQHN